MSEPAPVEADPEPPTEGTAAPEPSAARAETSWKVSTPEVLPDTNASERHAGTWVVLPTYDEADNLPGISRAILETLPGSTLLVVDDASPDGTGALADELAATEPRIHVKHRPGKQGLGRAYIDGFRVALAADAQRIIQMDADWSHSPSYLPALMAALDGGADLVIGSRYVAGGGVRDWGFARRLVSRGGSIFARSVLRLLPHDLTGGFKAWRAGTLREIDWSNVHAGGYVFQIETTYLASRAGARVAEVPIVFTDRRVGVSKMSRRIIAEALMVVLRLRWEELRGRGPGGRGSGADGDAAEAGRSPADPGASG
jgi:dolichol-phosphate mannosyltransferase